MQKQAALPSLLSVGLRRWLLQAGLGALTGLSVPQLLQARAATAERGRDKSEAAVIQIWLSGGPSQVDTWDPKPEMPIRNRPLAPGDLVATVFQHLGIDPCDHWISPSGRPTPLVEKGKPIAELF